MGSGNGYPPGDLKVKDHFDEVFEVELDGWCYGITHFAGEINPYVVHMVIKELGLAFGGAVSHNYVFDVLQVSTRISKAAKYLVPEKEIAFSILAQLPNPSEFGEDGQFIIAQLVDQVEQAYGGAIERLQRKWQWENEKGGSEKTSKRRRAA